MQAIRTNGLNNSGILESAAGIMASGHVYRSNRPNTWLHRPSLRFEDSPWSRRHMALRVCFRTLLRRLPGSEAEMLQAILIRRFSTQRGHQPSTPPIGG
jgi:hypothetical protein